MCVCFSGRAYVQPKYNLARTLWYNTSIRVAPLANVNPYITLPVTKNLVIILMVGLLFFFSLCRWFCHLDDDNYLNTRNLVSYLQQYNPEKEDVYVGFTQLRKPISTNDKQRPGVGSSVCINLLVCVWLLVEVCVQLPSLFPYTKLQIRMHREQRAILG